MNSEQPIPFPDDLNEDWLVAELTEAPEEPSLDVPDSLRHEVSPVAPLVLPQHFAEHRGAIEEAPRSDLQTLLYAVVSERPAVDKDYNLMFGEIETYDIMYTLSHDVEDLTEILMAHWGRRIGYMLAGMPFDKSEKIHWYFDRDIPSADAYHAAIEHALAVYERIPGNSETLQEIIHFASPGTFYRSVLHQMIGVSLAEIQHWHYRDELRKTGDFVVSHVLSEQGEAIHEPSPMVVEKVGPYRHDVEELEQLMAEIVDSTTGQIIPGDKDAHEEEERNRIPWRVAYQNADLLALPLDEIMNEHHEIRAIGLEDELDPEYMGLIRIAAMARKIADEEYTSEDSFRKRCRGIAYELCGKDSLRLQRIVHNARFAAFVATSTNYKEHHWSVQEYSLEDEVLKSTELAQTADAMANYMEGDMVLTSRLDLFLLFVAANDEEMQLARRVAHLTVGQIAKWRQHTRHN